MRPGPLGVALQIPGKKGCSTRSFTAEAGRDLRPFGLALGHGEGPSNRQSNVAFEHRCLQQRALSAPPQSRRV